MKGKVGLPSGAELDFSGPALVMAIVNCTDDSFYPPSRSADPWEAAERALAAVEEGAAIIDFGGESTRPGAAYVPEEEELRRLIPVIRTFRRQSPVPVSVDTRKAAAARAALDAGADIINDISALEDDPALGPVCAERGAPVVLMHKKGTPQYMQERPYYTDPAGEVGAYLAGAAERAGHYGIPKGRIILDPGIGFGKRLEDNLIILSHLAKICGPDYPVLVGISRKTFVGELTGRDVSGRLAGSLAAGAAALMEGADILRVHDVRETVDLVKVLYAIARYKDDRREGV
jgi:dihydropteroate synthase